MPTRSEPVDPWRRGDYVLGVEGKPVGPIRVSGLAEVIHVLEAHKNHQRANFPYLEIAPLDRETNQWFTNWFNESQGTSKRDVVIRDNHKNRWFGLFGCFFKRFGGDPFECTLVINGAEVGDKLPED